MNIEHLLTEDNLNDYLDTGEKFTFCLDLLNLSLTRNGHGYCEQMVNQLEDAFCRLIRIPTTSLNENGWTP